MQGIDWRDKRARGCNAGRNPIQDSFYDGINVDPLEVLFVKVKASMRDAKWSHVMQVCPGWYHHVSSILMLSVIFYRHYVHVDSFTIGLDLQPPQIRCVDQCTSPNHVPILFGVLFPPPFNRRHGICLSHIHLCTYHLREPGACHRRVCHASRFAACMTRAA